MVSVRPSMIEHVHINGRAVDRGAASVSLYDRGFLLGDAVFETLRAYHGRVFALDRHLARLARGLEVLAIEGAPSLDALGATVERGLADSGLASAVLRLTLSRGEGPRGIGTTGYGRPTVALTVAELSAPPAWAHREGIDARIVEHRRVPPACIDPTIKHANYLPSILGRRELTGARELEGVVLSVQGEVVCGLVSNLFVVAGGALITPHLAAGCLPGVTRAEILACARALGLPVEERAVWPAELERADELFFTNTLYECLPVARLGARALPAAPGPITQALHRALGEEIERRCRGTA